MTKKPRIEITYDGAFNAREVVAHLEKEIQLFAKEVLGE